MRLFRGTRRKHRHEQETVRAPDRAEIGAGSGASGTSGEDGATGEAAGLLAEIAALPAAPEDEVPGAEPRGLRRLLSSLTQALGRGAGKGARAAGKGARSLTDRLIEVAPRIPVRQSETLRAQHPGLDTEQLAEKLVQGSVRATTAVGAGVGGAAMLPNPLTMPVELAAETLAVAVIEVKLVAELHEVYGVPAAGTGTQRAMAYLNAWANERGIDVTTAVKLSGVVGSAAKKDLRDRLVKRTVRSAPSVTPFLIGAVVGAVMNRRDTRKLAEKVRKDLRGRGPAIGSGAQPALAADNSDAKRSG
jgi:hypothetical protein